MCCHVTLTVLLKIEIAVHIDSFVFHNEQKNQDISPSSTAADYYQQEPLPHQTSQVSHM